MSNDTRIGMYICTGCDIAEGLDVDKLVETAGGDVHSCKTHPGLCSPDGIKIIKDDIESEELTAVSVAACSNREKTDEFTFKDGVILDRISLREQVVWTHEPKHEDTQSLGEDMIRMGIAKINHTKNPEPYIAETSKTILVVGGGVAGLTSAMESSASGYEVVLVEKEAELGGMMKLNHKSFPKAPPYKLSEHSEHPKMIEAVNADPKITVLLSSTIGKVTGMPGDFDVVINNGSSSKEFKIGSIIQATGWQPYDPANLDHLGYGASPDVITNMQFEEMVSKGEVKRPSNGAAIENVVFVQCAGSRDPERLPYCSTVCCNVTLKQSQYVRAQYPKANIYVIYKDMRTPGQHELYYLEGQSDDRVFFTKGEIANIAPEGDKVAVDVDDTLLGTPIRLNADMVVLAAGMVPNASVDVVEKPEEEKPAETTGDAAEGAEKEEAPAVDENEGNILNLQYRQGPDLPNLKYGFPDSHYICFPYETRRTGIYTTGAVRAPMDTGLAASDAKGAVLKAIQAVECISRGEAVHPRSGDMSYPEFSLNRCTQCKRCTEECPFGTLNEDEKGTPALNINRCRRCGICLGACPERIINFPDYSIEMVSQIIKSIDVPDEFEEKPRMLCFICENDALPVMDIAARQRQQMAADIRFIPVRCLGAVSVVWISDALSSGFDGIMLLGCQPGDDYQCHFMKGSELAGTRMENVQDKLKQLVLEPERVKIDYIGINQWDKLVEVVNGFSEEIGELDLNPYKGF